MEIQDLTGQLVLRTHLGEGEYNRKKVNMSMANQAFIIEYDAKMFAVPFLSIVKDVIERHEK